MLVASLAAGLAAMISCADAMPTSPARIARGRPVFLNATAAAAVETVLADVSTRVPDAIEDDAIRASFADALRSLTVNVSAGMLDDAERSAGAAQAALTAASVIDSDGTGDADRSAIGLALDVAREEINNARLAAGGIQ